MDLTSRIATEVDGELVIIVQTMNCYHQIAIFSFAEVATRDA